MKINDFKLEVYFDQYEFSAPYLLTQSDCEAMEIADLLALEPGSKEKFLHSWLGYTEVQGSPELRSLVAGLYQNIREENLIMHTGAQEAIFAFMNVLLEKGDHVISMFPVYQSLYEVALAEGCEVSHWELKPGEKGWTIDFDELEALIRPNTKLIVVNTPNNPTGFTFNSDEMKRLCEIAEKHSIYLFSDEVYRGLEFAGSSSICAADLYEKAASLGVMSKAYGLPGLRIGWVATRDSELIQKMKKFKHYMSICNSAPSEALSIIALRNGEKLLKRNKDIIKANIDLAEEFFIKYSSLFKNYRPMSGPIAFHKMEIDQTMDVFCDNLVKKSGVLLLPASMYAYPGTFFRMGYGRRSFPECLAKFEQYLIEHSFV